jgi:2-polyprenyl-6-methoxyphenol hydroxylase-like FAD-dependent oxidoreductase
VARASSEVLVVGAGPAGCAAATLLARWGHGVTLLAKPPGPTDLGESIPPSTRKLFDVLGVRAEIDAAPFIRSTGNTVWWGSAIPRIEAFADGERGWQVTSGALAAILLEHAKRAGVEVECARADVANVSTRAAKFVLDCTGRTGLLARPRGLRVYDSRYRTIAMVGVWRSRRPFDVPDPSHTLIESYDGGWAWSVPGSSLQERFVAVMVDPRTSDDDMSGLKPGPAGREVPSGAAEPRTETAKPGLALYREQLRRTKQMARIIADATLAAGPAGWDASMYHATRYVDENRVLLVGDAASFLDPVSSAGIKKALESGWLSAVAVHTALARPAMRDTALAFFASREAEVYAAFRSMTGRFLSEAAAGHAHPFWNERSEEPLPIAAAQETAAAFERLRQAPRFRVTRSTSARIEPRPTVRGAEIVMEPRLVSGREDAGVRHAFGVDLVALVDLAPAYTSVPDLFAVYTQRQSPVPWPDFLRALATTLAHKWLVWV